MADGVDFLVNDIPTLTADLAAHSIKALGLAGTVVRTAAYKVAADAQQLVPVDTGATKNSIHVTTKAGGLEADIGPTTSYAPFLEFGTSRMAPRPYMSPALDRNAEGFTAAVAQIVDLL